ncbi:unnamed protein product [Moneuplotes crassus]|uniref:Uncharacterized protein n=1 Tax=Euplotes crassus TaxID=5936 RepID=A0AAD1XC85_EUPCR|nr:unnamed protein product [Moneuplotes crassus]
MEQASREFADCFSDSPASVYSKYEAVAPQVHFQISSMQTKDIESKTNQVVSKENNRQGNKSHKLDKKKIPYKKIIEGLAIKRLSNNRLKNKFQNSGFVKTRSVENLKQKYKKSAKSTEDNSYKDSYGQQANQRLNFFKFSSPLELRNKPDQGIQRASSHNRVVNKFMYSRNGLLSKNQKNQHSQISSRERRLKHQSQDMRFRPRIKNEVLKGIKLKKHSYHDKFNRCGQYQNAESGELQTIHLSEMYDDYDPSENSPMRNEHIRKLYLEKIDKAQEFRKFRDMEYARRGFKGHYVHEHSKSLYFDKPLDRKKEANFQSLKVTKTDKPLFSQPVREKMAIGHKRMLSDSLSHRKVFLRPKIERNSRPNKIFDTFERLKKTKEMRVIV